jgi:D-glycero-alpha-D-manno-heptose-7-phosphate kinase
VHLERGVLADHGGIQDQYIAAHGGICLIENNSLADVRVRPLPVAQGVLAELSRNLLLFYTGVQRSSSDIIKAQAKENAPEELIHLYDAIKEIGKSARSALLRGDLDAFGKTFHEHWLLKRGFAKQMTNSNFDLLYEHALRHGALGGKLVGAGGGGFFLFYVPVGQADFRERMEKQRLTHVSFGFDFEGVTTVLNREF